MFNKKILTLILCLILVFFICGILFFNNRLIQKSITQYQTQSSTPFLITTSSQVTHANIIAPFWNFSADEIGSGSVWFSGAWLPDITSVLSENPDLEVANAIEIVCIKKDMICNESDAMIYKQRLRVSTYVYKIDSWGDDGKIAAHFEYGRGALWGRILAVDTINKTATIREGNFVMLVPYSSLGLAELSGPQAPNWQPALWEKMVQKSYQK